MEGVEGCAQNGQSAKECRICKETNYPENMIAPCKCSGSMEFAHRKCLQEIIRVSYQTRCRICKTAYKTDTEDEVGVKECCICKDTNNPELMINACNCSGTMKYTHKTCLVSWVQTTREMSCRVCKCEYRCTFATTRLKFWKFVRQEFYDLFTIFGVTLLISSIMFVCTVLLARMDLNQYNRMMSERHQHYRSYGFRKIVSYHEFYFFKIVLIIENVLAFLTLWILFFYAVRDEWNRHIQYRIVDEQAN